MNPIIGQSHPHQALSGESALGPSATPARLQLIHELVRSGDYHVPATAIADRMIEHMMVDKRERES